PRSPSDQRSPPARTPAAATEGGAERPPRVGSASVGCNRQAPDSTQPPRAAAHPGGKRSWGGPPQAMPTRIGPCRAQDAIGFFCPPTVRSGGANPGGWDRRRTGLTPRSPLPRLTLRARNNICALSVGTPRLRVLIASRIDALGLTSHDPIAIHNPSRRRGRHE